jgi:transposase
MIVAGQRLPILIATRAMDFRCGHQGLALMVQTELKLDPHSGVTVIFRSKRADRLKILVWDSTGMVPTYKILEHGNFAWPKIQDGTMRLSKGQYEALLEGSQKYTRSELMNPQLRSFRFAIRVIRFMASYSGFLGASSPATAVRLPPTRWNTEGGEAY